MIRVALLAVVLAAFAGCSGPEPLPPKPAEVPAGVDLSGQWRLRASNDATAEEIAEAARRAAGDDKSLLSRSGRKASRSQSAEYHVNVFLESGTALKLTQTEHGLFVSFDRSVVEEYRFGEQRTINVGPVVAERVSGWEQGAYVIETRDEEGAMLIETYRLDGADTMVRTIRIVNEGVTELDIQQLFDRI